MRLFTKIFLFGMLIFGLAFSVSGYFLLHYSLGSSMTREAEFALKQYQYDKFTVQSALLNYSDVSVVVSFGDSVLPWNEGAWVVWKTAPDGEILTGTYEPEGEADVVQGWVDEGDKGLFRALSAELSVPAAFFAEDKTVLYSGIEGLDEAFLDSLSENAHSYCFRDTPEGSSVLVGSILTRDRHGSGEDKIRFVTQWDISRAMEQQDTLQQYFIRCYLIAMAAGTVLLIFLSAFLTRPLKRISGAAREMAEGCYEGRIRESGRDEIGELAVSFNRMAEAVEEKIGELSKAAVEKEDFVANFAHELKTPLTSIIGYADTIYQKDMSREDTRRAAWRIWNEGMRLESLSFKLMELIVLGRQDFTLQEMPADELLRDVTEGLEPLLAEREIEFQLQTEEAYVRADYDLLKTLLLNLADNSAKAGCSRMELTGKREGTGYRIRVRDNGCGMEEEELTRITEAFYMVDKARSRKQHGAGLGLALADRIARIHGSRLMFVSRKGEGTEVSILLTREPDMPGERELSAGTEEQGRNTTDRNPGESGEGGAAHADTEG